MRTPKRTRRHAPRLFLIFTTILALSLTTAAPLVSADSTSYDAATIETWLENQIIGATVEITDAATVLLESAGAEGPYMRVDGISLNVLGVTVGLNPIKFIFDGTQDVLVRAELDLFGISPAPKIECEATIGCVGPDGPLEITAIDAASVKIGSFEPTLTTDDIDAIIDVINQIIVASGLTVSAPSATLAGITVLDDGDADDLQLSWSEGGDSYMEASELQAKINGMVGTLETKATSYLQSGEGNWTVTANIVSDVSLEIAASLTAFGVTATLDVPITFSTLTATIADGAFTIGDAPKSVTFDAVALVGCSNYIPYIEMQSFALGDEYPGLRDYVAQIEDIILSSTDDAFDDIVGSTGLEFPYWSISQIAVEGTYVVLYSAESVTIPLPLEAGWNLVSIPVTPADDTVEVVFPDAVTVYTWDGDSYLRVAADGDVAIVEPCHGYWVRMDQDDLDFAFHGAPLGAGQTLDLVAGWNMVGVASTTAKGDLAIEEAGDPLQRDYIYAWDPTGKTYGDPVDELVPGTGYWLACTEACTLVVS